MKYAFYFFLVLSLTASVAQADDSCTEDKAVAAAKADPAVVKFCAAAENGCDFSASAAAQDETDPAKKWLVKISQIHSFDDAGKPRFMPEGAIFADVSDSCGISDVRGHGVPLH